MSQIMKIVLCCNLEELFLKFSYPDPDADNFQNLIIFSKTYLW